jgi:hypothetical protein
MSRPQTSSSSKNAGPICELKKLTLFDLTGKDLQCFSHEDGCFAAGNELQEQPERTVVIPEADFS